MSQNEQEDTKQYKVVVNHEEQYSIWFAERELPLGWNEAGKSGLKSECLEYIYPESRREEILRGGTDGLDRRHSVFAASDSAAVRLR